jgi:hypothetical protein
VREKQRERDRETERERERDKWRAHFRCRGTCSMGCSTRRVLVGENLAAVVPHVGDDQCTHLHLASGEVCRQLRLADDRSELDQVRSLRQKDRRQRLPYIIILFYSSRIEWNRIEYTDGCGAHLCNVEARLRELVQLHLVRGAVERCAIPHRRVVWTAPPANGVAAYGQIRANCRRQARLPQKVGCFLPALARQS